MKTLWTILICLVLASAALAQATQAFIVDRAPKGGNIRLTVKDSLGQVTDGGEFVPIVAHQQLAQLVQLYRAVIAKHFDEGLQVLDPQLAAALKDTNMVLVPKSSQRLTPVNKKK